MNRLQYLAVLAVCVAATLPLEFVIGARVWRAPRRLLYALWFPFVAFGAWDFIATARGQWSFNRVYTTPVRLPFGVPAEELLFFVVVPICAVLTLEAVRKLRGREPQP